MIIVHPIILLRHEYSSSVESVPVFCFVNLSFSLTLVTKNTHKPAQNMSSLSSIVVLRIAIVVLNRQLADNYWDELVYVFLYCIQ